MRPLDAALGSAKLLEAMGYRPIIAPVTQIVAAGARPPGEGFDAVLATSARAFAFLSGESCARLASAPLFAVGEETAAAARARGLAGRGAIASDAPSLTPMLLAQFSSGARLLYLAAQDRKSGIETALAAAGIEVRTVEIYRAEARSGWSGQEAHDIRQCAVALHYSRRGAALAIEFAARAGCAEPFRALTHVCISTDVAGPLRRAGAGAIAAANQPNEAALFVALQAAMPRA